MTTALTKEQVEKDIDNRIFPDFVIQAFNECIRESKLKNSDDVKREDVIVRIMELGSVQRSEIFENKWLDVENYYRKAGWEVEYYSPPYYEVKIKPYFTFK